MEWWPISSANNPGKQADVNICTKLNCSPQPFNARWRHLLQCTVMITPLLMRVETNSCTHWKKRLHPHLIPRTEVMNHQMILLLKSSPLMEMSPCSLKRWCDVRIDRCPRSQRKRIHQAQSQLRVTRRKSEPNERVLSQSITIIETRPCGSLQRVSC